MNIDHRSGNSIRLGRRLISASGQCPGHFLGPTVLSLLVVSGRSLSEAPSLWQSALLPDLVARFWVTQPGGQRVYVPKSGRERRSWTHQLVNCFLPFSRGKGPSLEWGELQPHAPFRLLCALSGERSCTCGATASSRCAAVNTAHSAC